MKETEQDDFPLHNIRVSLEQQHQLEAELNLEQAVQRYLVVGGLFVLLWKLWFSFLKLVQFDSSHTFLT